MNETEEQPIRITLDDVAEANRLSLHCPICAGAVEQHVDGRALVPVYCVDCQTMYHMACWEQNGGKCAILGCEGRAVRRHGALDLGPALKISERDIQNAPAIPRPVHTGSDSRTKRLKRDERRMHKEMQRRFRWRDFFESVLRAIRLWPSDPS